MKHFVLALAVLALPLASVATEKTTKTTATVTSEKTELKLINTTELETLLTNNKATTFVYDANNEKTRSKDGVIPGAKLLTSSSNYDASVLPADKNATLVFYCANQKCMASHDAAKLALKQGYKNAIVMADGVQGWKKAGKPTEKWTKN